MGARSILILLAALALVCIGTLHAVAADRPLEGFGADTPGGSGGDAYVVTSLSDAGPGTLRDAVSVPNRNISFAVGGTIRLESSLVIAVDHLTIDAGAAPCPGVTITAAHSGVKGALVDVKGAHDLILRHLRVVDAPDPDTGDNLRICDSACNIVVDHCSFRRAADGDVDISDGAHDVTVQWSILAETVKNSLIRTGVYNVSLHHNLFVKGDERNPQLDDAESVDIVNNVIADWSTNYGTRIRNGASANLVKNYYAPGTRSDGQNAVVLLESAGPVYMEGNELPDGCPTSGTASDRLPAPPITEMTPEEALRAVIEEAGARPLDATDSDYVGAVAATPVRSMSWGTIKSRYL